MCPAPAIFARERDCELDGNGFTADCFARRLKKSSPNNRSEWTGEQARYMANRRELGYEMYSIMGIGRADKKGRCVSSE